MPFRESSSLLDNDKEHYFRIRRQYLTTFNWKSILICICSALIPLILWVTIFQSLWDQNSHQNSQNQNLLQLKLPESGPNFTKIPKYFKSAPISKSPTTPTPSQPPVTISSIGNTTIYTYTFTLTSALTSPDNYVQPSLLINLQSPGPLVQIRKHSILIVQIDNRLGSEVTFHFHGIHQRKSFLSDGVPSVTQKPIPPGQSYTYEFDTWPQVGTFFYHAHTSMDIVWLYGPLVILDDQEVYKRLPQDYQYDDERVFLLNGVYHEGLEELVDRIAGPVHNYPVLISSITINGRSYGEWDTQDSTRNPGNSSNSTEPGYFTTTVEKGLRYRFRFINAASDSLLSCRIDSHALKVIETDGIYIHPIDSDHLVLSPGQRYSVIVTMDKEEGNYELSCVHMESQGPLNGIAYLNYKGSELPIEMLRENRRETGKLEMDRWVIDEIGPNFDFNQTDLYRVPIKVDKEWVIDVFEAVVGTRHVYLINGHYFQEPEIPYFMQLKQSQNISDPPQIFEILEGETIQFVFQNQRSGDFCFSHPWHIHGHSFHVVGEGPDRYDPGKDGQQIQHDILAKKRFQFRDSVTVYANQSVGEHVDGAYCGWAAVRFAAHNPGLWLVHCHVTPHMIMGKKFVIWEHEKEDPYLTEVMNIKRRGNASDVDENGGLKSS